MQITIIGSGFAALESIKQLRKRDHDDKLTITVISPQKDFLYSPSLIWVPSGQRDESTLQAPLAHYFHRHQVIHLQQQAIGIRADGREVVTDQGLVKNDGLIIACGGQYMRKAPGIEHTIHPCMGVAETLRIREAVEKMISSGQGGTIAMGFAGNPKEPSAVRGGPLFEFLFGLHTQLKQAKCRDRFKLIFFTPMPEPGKRLGAHAVKGLLRAMKQRDIETHLGHKIKAFKPGIISTTGGDIQADLTVFLSALQGQPWFANCDLPLSEGGFFLADEQARCQGAERVFVAGDAGSFPGPDWKAKQAHMAELQARTAANNLYDDLTGDGPGNETFRTELICIVDTLDNGMLVSRFPHFNIMLPPMRLMHGVKKYLERKTLNKLR